MAGRQVINKLLLLGQGATASLTGRCSAMLEQQSFPRGAAATWICINTTIGAKRAMSSGSSPPGFPKTPGAVAGGLELPSRRHLFKELPAVNAMLPNRSQFMAQFTPHGILLVPTSFALASKSTASAASAAVVTRHCAAATASAPVAMEEPKNRQLVEPMMAIGIKTQRRIKMKKHKIRKRRRATRMQN